MHKFLPQLVQNCFYLKVGNHIELRRLREIQQEFITQLRKQILQRKIAKSFSRKRVLELKKRIIVEMRIHAMESRRVRRNIQEHLDEAEFESNMNIVQIAYNSLKERVVRKKFKYISQHCHKLRTCKKVFFALQAFAINQKIENSKVAEIRRIQEAKYLWIWRQIYIKEVQNKEACKFVEGTLLHQIMQSWRAITEK